jgi:hypothetical protein
MTQQLLPLVGSPPAQLLTRPECQSRTSVLTLSENQLVGLLAHSLHALLLHLLLAHELQLLSLQEGRSVVSSSMLFGTGIGSLCSTLNTYL